MDLDMDGRRVLVELLGSMSYRRMITELRKDLYTEEDYHDLARSVGTLVSWTHC